MLPVQRALYARLTGDTALAELAPGGVHDGAPEGTPYPYIVIGEAIETPDNTHDGYGRQVVSTLHIWTRARGHSPGLAILARMTELLDHQPLGVDGWDHVVTGFEFSQTLTDPEPPGDIRHIPARWRTRVDLPRT
ncbi:DUF3168 domain-containing protein [Streptomyces sp. 3MP-14]|uniref:DUF3168 domain-containing protein n=1 Tax=Streptomyces mimosae TaxID=2586635 RepID=A0A5N6AGL7_9ACTN|nr:DUF3168 domain-containing protein [Streptomyces mimosae]KAB8177245.1 DUF3168 domain-containing protein [Streptomyces sp. 3MP-14]